MFSWRVRFFFEGMWCCGLEDVRLWSGLRLCMDRRRGKGRGDLVVSVALWRDMLFPSHLEMLGVV